MSQASEWVAFAAGFVIAIYTASSVLRSLVIPRGLNSYVTAGVGRVARKGFIFLSNRFDNYEAKDKVMAVEGPTYLMLLLITWLTMFLAAFTLMIWPLSGSSLNDAFIQAGSSMFTLGFAATERTGAAVLHFMAAATGLIVVALMIAYLPTLYSAFNRREMLITLLQSRAGAPAWGPEILARHHAVGLMDELQPFYAEWERWAAEVAESHTNYPALIYFRSPHPLRSWVIGLLAVMDAAALQLALSPSTAPTQARLCLRMGFSCLRYIADLLRIEYDPDPLPDDPIEMQFEEFAAGVERLQRIEFPMERTPEEAWPDFRGWRVNYESLAYALADLVVAPPGPWSGERSHLPGMAIVPERPPDRTPRDPSAHGRPKAERFGWHV